jgi:hypothetical protein
MDSYSRAAVERAMKVQDVISSANDISRFATVRSKLICNLTGGRVANIMRSRSVAALSFRGFSGISFPSQYFLKHRSCLLEA